MDIYRTERTASITLSQSRIGAMVKFIGDRCHADTLSGIAERFGTGYLHDIIIGITGYARLVRRLERTSEVLAEIHGKISQVLENNGIVFGCQFADDL